MVNGSPERLEERLNETLRFIDELPQWACPAEEKENLKKRAEHIRSKLKELATGVLTIGLLGGTGVGKSTITNALAGETISSVSHRRPHTGEIIIYVHEETAVPDTMLNLDLSLIAHRHRAQKARNIIVCDVPDFDSIKKEHRKLVRQFLKLLDIVVWVTSPEKYADEAFYEFLRDTIKEKAPTNFYFVMNKVDLLSGEIERLEHLTSSFTKYLAENGVEQPKLFLISAIEILRSEPVRIWNQWHLFEREIFRERELKEIRHIKSSNLFWELEQIEVALGNAIRAFSDAAAHVKKLRQELSDFSELWNLEGKRISESLLNRETAERLLSCLYEGNYLRGTAFIIAQLSRISSRSDKGVLTLEVPESTKNPFTGLSDRLNRVLLIRSVPESLIRELSELYDPEYLWSLWKERLLLMLDGELDRFKKRKTGLFVTIQNLFYWGIVLIFVLSLGELRYMQEKPLLIWIGNGLLRFFERIFTFEGLGALLSLIILEFFVGYWFFRSYRNSLQEKAQKVIERLGTMAMEIWKEVLAEVADRLKSVEETYMSWAERNTGKKEVTI